MSAKKINILLVENTETDAHLTIRQIHKINPDFQVRVVESLPDVEVAIAAFNPQMIISDYNLPTCTGMDVLTLVREKLPNAVFIFLTGTLQDEELAAETILNGADGFILKKHIKNLVSKLSPYLDKISQRSNVEQEARRQINETSGLIKDIRSYLDDVNAENLTYQERINKIKDHLDSMKKSIK